MSTFSWNLSSTPKGSIKLKDIDTCCVIVADDGVQFQCIYGHLTDIITNDGTLISDFYQNKADYYHKYKDADFRILGQTFSQDHLLPDVADVEKPPGFVRF